MSARSCSSTTTTRSRTTWRTCSASSGRRSWCGGTTRSRSRRRSGSSRRTSSSRPAPAVPRTRACRRRWCARSPAACRCSASASATRRSSNVFGGEVGAAHQLVHGKATDVHHDGRGIFAGLPQDFPAGRYHSLAATSIPDSLEVSATAADGEVMAVRHRELAGRRRAVPSRVGADAVRARAREELPGEHGVIQQALAQLLDGRDLSRDEARGVMNTIMSGEATPAQIGGFLVALRLKGETADEIAGCAEAMREHVLRIQPDARRPRRHRRHGRRRREHVEHLDRRRARRGRRRRGRREARQPRGVVGDRRGGRARGARLRPRAGARADRAVDRRARLRLPLRAGAPPGDEVRRRRCGASSRRGRSSTCSAR